DRDHGSDPAEERLARRSRGAEEPATRPEDYGVRPGSGDRGVGFGHQAGTRWAARSRKADWLLPLLRPDRGRQDRGGTPARADPRDRDNPVRYVRVYEAAYRVPPDRRTARLCRLRPRRAVDRRDRSASAQRVAAGRDREGPPRPLQHPV